ncbi:hypothetical protein [Pseudomonas sp.]|uniref:hypothetical protein n=1 Tax=Pseudomonas sp. TaxID=306 RepID=UPI003FD75184
MTYSISCVLLIPAAQRDQINMLANSLGYGPDSLSVPLTKADGSAWYGCHTWCGQLFLDQLVDPAYQSTISALIVSAVPDGDPTSSWAQALASNGLSVLNEEQPE